jgi:hypothetical protein
MNEDPFLCSLGLGVGAEHRAMQKERGERLVARVYESHNSLLSIIIYCTRYCTRERLGGWEETKPAPLPHNGDFVDATLTSPPPLHSRFGSTRRA